MSESPSPEPDWAERLRDLAAEVPPTKTIPVELVARLLSDDEMSEEDAVRAYKRLMGRTAQM